MPGWPRCSWAQSAVTSTSLRLMGFPPGWWWTDFSGGAGPPDDQVELAAEAEARRGVEQGGHEGQPGGDGTDDRRAEQVARGADHGESEAHELGEPWGRLGFPLAHRPQPGR